LFVLQRSFQTMAINVKGCIAEFVAMMLFVYVGCGSAAGGFRKLEDGNWDPASTCLIALQFGLAITVLAYATGHTSGGHINCAVTFALVLMGQVDPVNGACYFVAQMLGSICGAALLLGATAPGGDLTGGLGSNGLQNENVTVANALITEALMTFLLVWVVAEVAVNKKSTAGNCAPIAIGLAVFLAHVVCIPITGCSINPTRSFGPALVSGTWNDHWIWWVGPLLGAGLAAVVSKFAFQSDKAGVAPGDSPA